MKCLQKQHPEQCSAVVLPTPTTSSRPVAAQQAWSTGMYSTSLGQPHYGIQTTRLLPAVEGIRCRHARHNRKQILCCSAPSGPRGDTATGRPDVQQRAQPTTTVEAPPQATSPPDMECMPSGLDNVSCYIVDPATHEGRQANAEELQQLSRETAGSAPMTPLQQALSLALLISPFAFWGTSMVAMKGLMVAVPPMLMGAFRLLPAGVVLVGWAAAQGRPQPSTPLAWAWVAAFALVDGAAFQGFLAEGLQRTSAGLGSVIIDSQPLTVAALAAVLFGETLGWTGVLGLLMGVAGLLLLEVPEQYMLLAADGLLKQAPADPAAVQQAAQQALGAVSALPEQLPALGAAAASTAKDWSYDAWAALSLSDLEQLSSPSALWASGELWMLLAAQSMAVGTVMVRYVMQHADPVMATGWHMILGGLMLGGVALAQDQHVVASAVSQLGPSDLASAAYVSLLGGAASYGIFFWQASTQGNLTKLSSLTFLTPVFAAVTGYFVLGEVLTLPQLVGGGITLSSVFLINSSKGAQGTPSKSSEDQQ